MAIQLEIVTPEKRVFSRQVDGVKAPGIEGSFGVLPGHTPFVAALEEGPLEVSEGGSESHFFIGGGFAQVQDDRVVILAESAEPVEAIDLERAERALAEARERLARMAAEESEAAAVERARVRRATARISMARRR